MSGTYVYDIEVYPNFFYALFEDLESGEHTAFTIDDIPRLKEFVNGSILIGFNSKNYDSVIIRPADEEVVPIRTDEKVVTSSS